MVEVVLDSSALLALYQEEAGSELVKASLDGALLSAVNLAEIVTKLVEWGALATEIEQAFAETAFAVVPFDADLAVRAGLLRAATRHRGLSLGDRACLALAQREGLAVLTADRAWVDLGIGIDVRPIR